jgi:hypothetical protein
MERTQNGVLLAEGHGVESLPGNCEDGGGQLQRAAGDGTRKIVQRGRGASQLCGVTGKRKSDEGRHRDRFGV